MPYIEDIHNITGYFQDSLKPPAESHGPQRIGAGVEGLLREWTGQKQRWPIRNREPRREISSRKRAIIHARDGNQCAYCPRESLLNIDHIVPRTAFHIEDLFIADRSDNLISVCWICNEEKSNYEHVQLKRPGVTISCWECAENRHKWYFGTGFGPPPEFKFPVYCGEHGAMTMVPDIDEWVI